MHTLTTSTRSDPVSSWQMSFASSRTSVPQVRAQVRRAARQWGYGPVVTDDAELVCAELASNAVLHGRTPEHDRFEVTLTSGPHGLTVEVRDGNSRLPERSEPAMDGENGRGLLLVQALSLRWGAVRDGRAGKRMWALLAAAPPDRGQRVQLPVGGEHSYGQAAVQMELIEHQRT